MLRASRARPTCTCTRWSTRRRCTLTSTASRLAELGLTQRDVANNVLVTLSSSAVVAPNYWSDPRSGINYIVAVQTPQSRVDSVSSLMSTSVTPVDRGGRRSS